MQKIVILGATSHIAKGLICNFNRLRKDELYLFARSVDSLKAFVDSAQCEGKVYLKEFGEFNDVDYDIIINCIGINSSVNIKDKLPFFFRLTETFDNLILDYQENHPDTLYINLSSGAAYGTDFSKPAYGSTCSKWDINNISESDYYGIAKLNSEAKHRALQNLNIVDLRIFGYFSRFANLDSKFLLTEIISCIKEGREFVTGSDNITRDYIHPKDLHSLIEKCIEKHKVNDVFDAYSLKPVTKFEILEYFSKGHGLKYIVEDDVKKSAITGAKNDYYSNNKKAGQIGYIPEFDSIDCIMQESKYILKEKKSGLFISED
ncbi:MAG: NAD(P)-dependent oxidoreductase [Candidatus Scalindua sp.]|jgi:nucleoside-diphosphate-sugar epimerase|nr:NAD(P)-dependent oxidoreductase [Candidatus Scalindua sp.]